jgi:hypothetical protein
VSGQKRNKLLLKKDQKKLLQKQSFAADFFYSFSTQTLAGDRLMSRWFFSNRNRYR